MTPQDWEATARGRLEAAVAARVKALHDLADSIERDAKRGISNAVAGTHEWSSYVRVAGQLTHSVTWGVANLNLTNVIEAAEDADKARNKEAGA